MIKVVVPAVPVAQPRARASTFGGHVRMYTPTKHPVTAFKATVRLAFQQAYQGPPLTGPLSCRLVFVMPRPKSLIWKKREMPRRRHIIKPDADNLCKSFFDALTGQVFIDDTQFCEVYIEKWIASGDEQPHVEAILEQLDEVA